MAQQIIQNNFIAIAMTLLLILFTITNNNFEKKTNRLFLLSAFCVLVLVIEEWVESQLALRSTYQPLRIVLSAVGYSLRPMIPLFLITMAGHYSKKMYRLICVPAIINVLVAFSALFCKAAFSYTADNQFVRGPLSFTPFLVAGFYAICLLTLAFRQSKSGGMREGMIISALLLLICSSTFFESVLHIPFVQNPSIACAITFYYLFLHSNLNNRDPLTGALTRRRFYLDADKNKFKLSAVISVDLNNLKILNDKYGHLEGDRALSAITGVIYRNIGLKANLYRVGGDEFMVLCFRMQESEIKEMIHRIQNDLDDTKYQCAIGYAVCSESLNFEQVCQLADHAMYDNKRKMKQLTQLHQQIEC